MLTYITSEEYQELLGESIPDNFNQLAIEASNYVNYKTFGRIDSNNIPEAVKYVTCLIVNTINEEKSSLKELGNLKSQNIEGWSETYSTPEEVKSNYLNIKENLLNEYLWNITGLGGIPLLYKGVDVVG